MKRTLAFIAVLAMLPMAQAQPGPHTPPNPAAMAQRQVTRFTTLLSLTPEQVDRATTIFTTEASAAATQHATERTAHQALEAAIKANDTATIQSTATTLGQMNGEMIAARATAAAQFYAVLNAEQKAKYSELEDEHRGGGPMYEPPRHEPPVR